MKARHTVSYMQNGVRTVKQGIKAANPQVAINCAKSSAHESATDFVVTEVRWIAETWDEAIRYAQTKGVMMPEQLQIAIDFYANVFLTKHEPSKCPFCMREYDNADRNGNAYSCPHCHKILQVG